jgi:hypothetical protein
MVEDWVKEGVIEKFNLYSTLAFIDFSEGALVYFSHRMVDAFIQAFAWPLFLIGRQIFRSQFKETNTWSERLRLF